jgi:tRNA threonylcarbamoyl adenosine modification protein (Sua5/YciO/YrdC/YwlC family)
MEVLAVHPANPPARAIARAVRRILDHGLIALASDSGYLLAWSIGDREARERVLRLRQLDPRHPFTLLCADLKQLGQWARVDDPAFRFIKARTPGPYTFILPPSARAPKHLTHGRQRSVGVRISPHAVPRALLAQLSEPLASSSLNLPGAALEDPGEIVDALNGRVDLLLDSGYCPRLETTVVDLTGDYPETRRIGAGAVDWT